MSREPYRTCALERMAMKRLVDTLKGLAMLAAFLFMLVLCSPSDEACVAGGTVGARAGCSDIPSDR